MQHNNHIMILSDVGKSEICNSIDIISDGNNITRLRDVFDNNPEILLPSSFCDNYGKVACIGRNIPVLSGNNTLYVDNLYISSSGNLVVIDTSLLNKENSIGKTLSSISEYTAELQKFDCKSLDLISSDYYFKTCGQAYNVIDILANNGFCKLSDEDFVINKINNSLFNSDFFVIILCDNSVTSEYSKQEIIHNFSNNPFISLLEVGAYKFDSGIIVVTNFKYLESVSCFHAEPYSKKNRVSRREFVSAFSDNGGYDPDEVSEFISSLEAVDGFSVTTHQDELTVWFSTKNNDTFPFLTFCTAANHSDLWIVPGNIKSEAGRNSKYSVESGPFLEFFKQYVNQKRCKYVPYESDTAFYYANVSDVIKNIDKFVSAAEQFAKSVTIYN